MKELKLTTGEVTFVDDEDYEDAISSGPWLCSDGKAIRFIERDVNGKSVVEYLHRRILPPIPGYEVDHKDGNGLNNTRKNLRYLTHSQNIHNRDKQKNNTTGYIGVRYSISAQGYQSSTQIDGKRTYHGTFKTAIEAAVARDEFVKKHLPGIAKLNFP